jgi:type I site-specific restriction endonuclease
VKQHIANARKARKLSVLSTKLKEFVEKVDLTPDHLLIPAADVSAQARSLHGKVQKLQEALMDLDVESYVGEEDLWRALESLLQTIRKCLTAAGRRIRE